MTTTRGGADRLAELLPRWHRLRDEQTGEPLRALLEVIGEQIERIGGDLDELYDDWFVETAADWVLPYLGDLVGYRPLPGVAASRRDVAATIGYRRRKGTLALLEDLAESVTGWPARAVETSRLLAVTQPVRLGARDRGRLADLRDGSALELTGTPFETLARTADVRRAASRRRQGGYTPAGVALYVWPRKPYSITRAPAYCIDRARNLYTFSILGNDTRLVTRPEPEPSATHIATIDNVPGHLRRRQFADRLTDYYGPGKSVTVWRDGHEQPIPPSDVVVADLTDWRYRPRQGQVAVDPELGRIAFGSRSAPQDGVWVTYHYAFGDDLGGGEYPRDREAENGPVYRVGPGHHEKIMDAFREYRADRQAGRCGGDGIIEIIHGEAYQEQLDLDLEPGDRLTLRAAEGTRPVLRLLDWYGNRPDALNIRAQQDCPPGEEPRVVLDGLLVSGRGINVTGRFEAFVLRHCTLVPGWSLEPECTPLFPEDASLVLERTTACVQIDRCVLGTIQVAGDEVGTDPTPIHIRDSILDATGHHRAALSAPDHRHAHAVLYAYRTTVIGEVHTHAVRLAENTIFTGRIRVARRQIGRLRYCYVPAGSRTPQRYRCQPDLAGPDHAGRVRPLLAAERYGDPDYGQLTAACAEEITRGAEDGGEMGAFHDLYQPQRTDALRTRLAEYTPAGTDAGVFFVT